MNAGHPLKYDVVQASSLQLLEEEVNKRLTKQPLRWSLAGGVAVASVVNSSFNSREGVSETTTDLMYHQAMIFK